VDDVLSRFQDLSTHHGGMHDIVMWYYVVNAWMHCVDVAMGIGIYIPSLRKTVVQRDVRFEEDRTFRSSLDVEQGEHQSPQLQVSPSQSIVLEFMTTCFKGY
jgi:hypothetical protein